MELRQDKASSGPIITGIAGNAFKVDGIVREGALLMTPKSLHPWQAGDAPLTHLADLVASMALDPAPELLLLGTGRAIRRPDPAEVAALEAMNVGLEAVDSRSAARIWGLLRAEGRWIAAALLPPEAEV